MMNTPFKNLFTNNPFGKNFNKEKFELGLNIIDVKYKDYFDSSFIFKDSLSLIAPNNFYGTPLLGFRNSAKIPEYLKLELLNLWKDCSIEKLS